MRRPSRNTRPHLLTALMTACAAALGTPAHAHHPMGGALPSTHLEGLLSGFGHPVIGPDHLAFIVAIGIAAALVHSGVALIGAFIAASTTGVLIHVGRLDVPLVEPLIASSVIAAGLAIAVGRGLGQPGWLALAAGAGLFHGYAFGEAVIGAEQTVVGAYLVGLAIMSAAIAGGVMLVSGRMLPSGDLLDARRRVAGGALSVVGLGLLALSLVGV